MIVTLCWLQLACGSTQSQKTPPAECQDPRFDSLTLKGPSRMTEQEYAYVLQSALNCDKAQLDQKNMAAKSDNGSAWKTIGLVLLAIILIIVAAGATPQNGGTGDTSTDDN